MGGMCQGSSQKSAEEVKMQYYTIASSNLFVAESLDIAIQYSLNLGMDIIDKTPKLDEKDKNIEKEKMVAQYKVLKELYNSGEDTPVQVTDFLKANIDSQTKVQKLITQKQHSPEELLKLIHKEKEKLIEDHHYKQVTKSIEDRQKKEHQQQNHKK